MNQLMTSHCWECTLERKWVERNFNNRVLLFSLCSSLLSFLFTSLCKCWNRNYVKLALHLRKMSHRFTAFHQENSQSGWQLFLSLNSFCQNWHPLQGLGERCVVWLIGSYRILKKASYGGQGNYTSQTGMRVSYRNEWIYARSH